MDTAALFGAVTYEILDDYNAFVGVKRSAKSKDGKALVNIAAALHEGFTLDVTPQMRQALFRRINKNKRGRKMLKNNPPGGPAKTKWVIPGRPFVRAVVARSDVQDQIRANWSAAVWSALTGG